MWIGLGSDNAGLAEQREGAYMSVVNDDVRDFLENRRAAFAAKEKELQSELVAVQARIRELDTALAVIGSPDPIRAGQAPRLTIKEAVMKILTPLAPRGLPALSILERLRVDFGMNYPRESLSPQLSRLKAEGRLSLQGGVWFSKENGSGAGAPEPQ